MLVASFLDSRLAVSGEAPQHPVVSTKSGKGMLKNDYRNAKVD